MSVLYHNPKCASGSRVLTQITTVLQQSIKRFGQPSHTQWKHVNVKVTVEGVLFFDVLHGQTGVAKNGVELHPVIGIQERRWRRANMSLETILIIVVILALLGFFGRGFIFRG